MEKRKKLAVILLLLGRYEVQVRQLDSAIRELQELPENIQVIVVADKPRWLTAPQLQMLHLIDKRIEVCYCASPNNVPAVAMNLGMSKVDAEYVQFALLQDPIIERVRLFIEAIKNDCDKDDCAFFISPNLSGTAEIFLANNFYGWSQTTDIGIDLGAFCVPTSALKVLGEIDENPILRDEIERWYALAVSQLVEMKSVGNEAIHVPRLVEYPLDKQIKIPRDMAIRYAVYSNGIAAPKRTIQQWSKDFWSDLNDEDRLIYQKITGILPRPTVMEYTNRYKILIVGGHFEYHHNQICFFNYLERLYGRGFATYRVVLEHTMDTNMVTEYDLVIFTRCRSDRAIDAVKTCKEYGIPSLYMIDDNWLTIAEEHPKEGAMFVPGNPDFDNFIEMVGLCKATWLYSELLKRDIMPYTRCVQQFQISVDPLLFQTKTRREKNGKLYVGFSGSLRWDNTAFRALARYARQHENVKVVLIGILGQEQELLFKNLDVLRLPFESYARYAKKMAEIQPDLLLAPIPHTHTAQSKCYNKYVESGVVGAACIFSNCLPYSAVVQNGMNGFLTEDESENGWYNALENALSNTEILRKIQEEAYRDVIENYTVDVLLPKFARKIISLIEENVMDD